MLLHTIVSQTDTAGDCKINLQRWLRYGPRVWMFSERRGEYAAHHRKAFSQEHISSQAYPV